MERKNYNIPPSYSLGGQGCASFLEPPAHPRHFTQSIFTRYGNSPARGPNYYFNGNGYDEISEVDQHFEPLPYDHPRVKAWEAYAYAYFRKSYSPDGTVRDCSKSVDNGPPSHHLAYLLVKKYYAQAEPRTDLIENPPSWGKGGGIGTWWEKLEEKPTPETCPSDSIGKHPVNGTWCQACGWVEGK